MKFVKFVFVSVYFSTFNLCFVSVSFYQLLCTVNIVFSY